MSRLNTRLRPNEEVLRAMRAALARGRAVVRGEWGAAVAGDKAFIWAKPRRFSDVAIVIDSESRSMVVLDATEWWRDELRAEEVRGVVDAALAAARWYAIRVGALSRELWLVRDPDLSECVLGAMLTMTAELVSAAISELIGDMDYVFLREHATPFRTLLVGPGAVVWLKSERRSPELAREVLSGSVTSAAPEEFLSLNPVRWALREGSRHGLVQVAVVTREGDSFAGVSVGVELRKPDLGELVGVYLPSGISVADLEPRHAIALARWSPAVFLDDASLYVGIPGERFRLRLPPGIEVPHVPLDILVASVSKLANPTTLRGARYLLEVGEGGDVS